MRARIFAAASACGSDECKAKAEEAAARLGEKLRALKVVDRFAAETKAVDNMADVADEDDKDVEATGKATCEVLLVRMEGGQEEVDRHRQGAQEQSSRCPREKKVDVDIVKTGLTEASCKEMLSKFVTQMRSSPKMKDKLATIGQLMKPKFEKEKKRCTAAARMTISLMRSKRFQRVAQEASKVEEQRGRFLSESSPASGRQPSSLSMGLKGGYLKAMMRLRRMTSAKKSLATLAGSASLVVFSWWPLSWLASTMRRRIGSPLQQHAPR